VPGPARLLCPIKKRRWRALRARSLYLRDVLFSNMPLCVVLRTCYLVPNGRRPTHYALLTIKAGYKICSTRALRIIAIVVSKPFNSLHKHGDPGRYWHTSNREPQTLPFSGNASPHEDSSQCTSASTFRTQKPQHRLNYTA
jgi:hypothetical protein